MRRVERLPIIYKILKNKESFDLFTDRTGDYNSFIDKYEELYYQHIFNPDLRTGQHLINNKIVPDGNLWYQEDEARLLKLNLVKEEEIFFWGSYGVDGEKKYKEWLESAPKINAPLTVAERVSGKFTGLKNYQVFSLRESIHNTRKPSPKYILLKDLEESHIQKILEIPNLDKMYKRILEGLLNKETISIKSVDIVCKDN